MSDLIAKEDIHRPLPGYPGAKILVARKGQVIPREVADLQSVAASQVEESSDPVENTGGGDAPDYSSKKVDELKQLVADRALTPDSERKGDLVAALEEDDEAKAAEAATNAAIPAAPDATGAPTVVSSSDTPSS